MTIVYRRCSALARRFYRYSPPAVPRQSAAQRRPSCAARATSAAIAREIISISSTGGSKAPVSRLAKGEWAARVLLQVISIASVTRCAYWRGSQPQTGKNIGVVALSDIVGFAVVEDGFERAAGGDQRASPGPLQQILRLGFGPGGGVVERHNNRTRAVPMHLLHYLFAK